MKTRRNIQSGCVDSLLIQEKDKSHNVLINGFNILNHDHTMHCGRKHFCCYCLQAFKAAEILKSHLNGCFKILNKY